MNRKGILRNIKSYLVRILIHLIKNAIEQPLTNSWAASIRYSLLEIQDLNLMENQSSFYIKPDQWSDFLQASWETALVAASAEVANGIYKPQQLRAKLNLSKLLEISQRLLILTQTHTLSELQTAIDQEFSQLPGGEDWSFEQN